MPLAHTIDQFITGETLIKLSPGALGKSAWYSCSYINHKARPNSVDKLDENNDAYCLVCGLQLLGQIRFIYKCIKLGIMNSNKT